MQCLLIRQSREHGRGVREPNTRRIGFRQIDDGRACLPDTIQHLAETVGCQRRRQSRGDPRLTGHGPKLFAGLSNMIDLELVSREEFRSGQVAMRYEAKK